MTKTNRSFEARADSKYDAIKLLNMVVEGSELTVYNLDVFIKNSSFVNTVWWMEGKLQNMVHIENCVFTGSYIHIQGQGYVMMTSVNLLPKYIIKHGIQRNMLVLNDIKNVTISSLSIDTVDELIIDSSEQTDLGMSMNNVTYIEIQTSVFRNIVSKSQKGSVLSMVSTSAVFIECIFQSNKGYYGIIYAQMSSIVNSNCSYLSNTAKMGGVFYLEHHVELHNRGCLFEGNSVTGEKSEGKKYLIT